MGNVNNTSNIHYLKISDMEINPRTQRALRLAHAEELANEFDWSKFGTPMLSFRDGRYFLLDGQHRVEGARIKGFGEKRVRCEVFSDLSEADEAALFRGRNNTKAVGTIDNFKIGVVARDPECVEIDMVTRSVGYVVSSTSATPGTLQAVAALRKANSRGTLERTLTVLRDSLGDAGMAGVLIDGLSLVIEKHPEVTNETLTKAISGVRGGMRGVVALGQEVKERNNTSQSQAQACALVNVLNRGKGGRKLPSWWA